MSRFPDKTRLVPMQEQLELTLSPRDDADPDNCITNLHFTVLLIAEGNGYYHIDYWGDSNFTLEARSPQGRCYKIA